MAKKVMIVDDDRSQLKIVDAFLSAHGYSVSCVTDGDEALAEIRKEVPDLIILDVQMPKMNGYTFMFELKKISGGEAVPIIVLTAKEGMAEIFKVEGVKEYVTKPLQNDVLLSLVKKYVRS